MPAAHREARLEAGETAPARQEVDRVAAPLQIGARRRPQPADQPVDAAQKSSLAATTISAAADGVGARRSATKSAIVTSTSCPTAEITGTGDS